MDVDEEQEEMLPVYPTVVFIVPVAGCACISGPDPINGTGK